MTHRRNPGALAPDRWPGMSARLDAVEALTNASIGLVVSWAATYTLMPMWGLTPSASASAGITAMFFALSFARAWVIRSIFRRWQ